MSDGLPAKWVGIEITRRCNLACPHCFTSSGKGRYPELSADACRALLCQLAEAGCRNVSFSGGEPLLRKDLEDLMKAGLEAGLTSYSLVTNGRLVTRERARSLRQSGVEVAMVSLDGVDATDHAEVRHCPPEDFDHAIEAILLLAEEGIRTCVAMILTRRNIERFEEMVALCERHGVRQLRTCTFIPTGRASELSPGQRSRFVLDPALLQSLWDKAFRARANGMEVSQDHGIGPWNEDKSLRCSAGRAVAYVDSSGDVYPCPGLLIPEFKVGSIHEDDVGQLLASDEMARVHKIPRKELQGRCGQCAHPDCSGGCRGAAYSTTGDVRGPAPYCLFPVARRERPAAFSDDRLRALGQKYGLLRKDRS